MLGSQSTRSPVRRSSGGSGSPNEDALIDVVTRDRDPIEKSLCPTSLTHGGVREAAFDKVCANKDRRALIDALRK